MKSYMYNLNFLTTSSFASEGKSIASSLASPANHKCPHQNRRRANNTTTRPDCLGPCHKSPYLLDALDLHETRRTEGLRPRR